MPKLSKFRVVNLIYNDTRHIYDETFDFNEGDNAMMLLANGGGKTVLTQMMLQPVIPRTDLKTRRFSDYFKNNYRPTVLMSEWKLDSEGGTLLTGLLVKNRTRKKRGGEEDRETLDIYAFTIQYHYHETWNIDNIPIISRDDNGRKTMRKYDDLVQELNGHQNKHGEFVSVFKWSDSSEAKRQYRSKLAEFGIVQQEWTDNILKINKEEAGLKSFFEDAKSSHALLRKKVLPVIENKLEENNVDNVELQTLVKNYARELVKNDRIINDEKTYRRFLDDSAGYEKSVEDLSKIDGELESAYDDIGRKYCGFRKFSGEMEKAVKTAEECIILNREEIRNINFEKECFDHYSESDEIVKMEKACNTLTENLGKLKTKYEKACHDMYCQKAAELFAAIKEQKASIEKEQARLRQRMEEGDEEEIELLTRVLKEKYNCLKGEVEKLCKKIGDEQEGLRKEVEENSIKSKRISGEVQALAKDDARMDVLIGQFDYRVEQLNKSNSDFKWNKNPLTDDYEVSLLMDYNEETRKEIAELAEEKKFLDHKVENTLGTIGHKEVENRNKEIEKTSLVGHMDQAKAILDEYNEEYKMVFEEIKVYGFEGERFHDKEYVADELKLIIAEKEIELDHLTLERAMVVQASESLKEGRLCSLPDEVVDFMDREGIEFQYGYKWLLDYEGEDLPRELYSDYLKVLPYSLIVEDDDLVRFREAVKSYKIQTVIPMVSYGLLSDIIEKRDAGFETEGLLFHTSFDEKLLDYGYKKVKVDSYTDRINGIDESNIGIRKSLDNIRNAIYDYNNFTSRYDKDSFRNLLEKVESLEEVIDKLKGEIEANRESIGKMNESLKIMKTDIEKILEKSGKLEIILADYSTLEKEYGVYRANRNQRAKTRKNLKSKNDELKSLEALNKKLQEIIVEKDKKLHGEKVEIQRIEKTIVSLGITGKADYDMEPLRDHAFFTESIDQLEGRYEEHKRKSGDMEDIKRLIASHVKYMKKNEFELGSLGLKEEEYVDIEYDYGRHSILAGEVDRLNNEISSLEKNVSSREGVILDRQKSLRKIESGILDKYEREELLSRDSIIDVDFRKRIKFKKDEIKEFEKSGKECRHLKMKSESSMTRLKDVAGENLREMEAHEFSIGIKNEEIDGICTDIVTRTNGIKTRQRDCIDGIRISYDRMNNDYGRNELLGNMLRNLLNGENIYRYDFVKRVMAQTRESIDRTLKKYEADLKTMKDKEAALFKFAMTRVSDVYDELDDIDRHSYIDVGEKRQKMMHIKLPKKESLDTSHVENHLREVIRRAKGKIENNDVSDLDKYLDSHLKLEQIFDQYVALKNIRINISKIEQNKISRISWEDVSKTSGGEVFVSVFVLFISLMSYTRGFQIGKKQQGKVIVMDNPFGPVSSGHLLEPLFKIAKTYNTQLICFTHINTSAITNQFELIYSLRVIREAGSNREHIEAQIAKDEKQAVEMIESSLFEIGDGDQIGFI